MYAVTIKYPNGAVINAMVTRARVREFRLIDCKGASIKIVKVKS